MASSDKRIDRRDFLKTTVGAGLAASASSPAGAQPSGLPRRKLGSTGVDVSVLAFGGGSHFLGRVDGSEEKVKALIERALDLGINYFDTAAGYTHRPQVRLSETYFGRILSPHRDRIFLASKAQDRDREGMFRSVETSSGAPSNRPSRSHPDAQPLSIRRARSTRGEGRRPNGASRIEGPRSGAILRSDGTLQSGRLCWRPCAVSISIRFSSR